jgi:hypothetical protein
MTDDGRQQSATSWNALPSQSAWYWCAVVDNSGQTSYIDGYASGPEEPQLGDAPLNDTVTVVEWTVQMTPAHPDYLADNSTAQSPSTSDTDDDTDTDGP